LVSQAYPPETARGGIGSQTYLKAHGLSGLGHDVFVISHSPDRDRHENKDEDVSVVRIPGFDGAMPVQQEAVRWLTYSTLVAAEVWRLDQRVDLDIVDFPEWAGEGYVHLLNRTPWHTIPTVVQIHGPLVMLAHTIGWPSLDSDLFRVGTEMERACLTLADLTISSSRCSADWCRQEYGLNRPIPIIHTGVDTELFRPAASAKDDDPTIVFAGKIDPTKGVLTLVEAACRLAPDFPGLTVRLIGPSEDKFAAEVLAVAHRSACSDLVDILGFVPREQLPSEICRGHVFAAPSLYEGGPSLVCLEAMACGLPVIASEGSGAEEIIDSGTTGLLVRPDDLEALTLALHRVLSDPTGAADMGKRARSYVVAEADSRACIHKFESEYRMVLKAATAEVQPKIL
jgi:glycosyltransferase involved in cell wall biosynthesis